MARFSSGLRAQSSVFPNSVGTFNNSPAMENDQKKETLRKHSEIKG
jgi:hypothetical protein